MIIGNATKFWRGNVAGVDLLRTGNHLKEKLMRLSTFLFLSFFLSVFMGNALMPFLLEAAPTLPYAIPENNRWDQGAGYFTEYNQLRQWNRYYVPQYEYTTDAIGSEKILPKKLLGVKDVKLVARETYILNSACPIEETSCYGKGDPVLFIHGYKAGTERVTGGGEGTWGTFPRLLWLEGYVPFEFRWNTGTRFQEAANDLERAINLIHSKTRKRIHIVAHSMGGVLTRTLLQGIHVSEDYKATYKAKMQREIASVVTIGSPYSGIADKDYCRGSTAIPQGRDSETIEFCGQLSCQQLGEDILGKDAAKFYGVADGAGGLLPKLNDLIRNPFPKVEMLSLIGLTTRRFGNDEVDEGDGLITFEGQRFGTYDSFELGTCSGNEEIKHKKQSSPFKK